MRALDDRLVIEATDRHRRARRARRARARRGRPAARETVGKAIEIGARVLDSEETAANVDYVRAEFERHAGALRERLMKQLEAGDEALAERSPRASTATATARSRRRSRSSSRRPRRAARGDLKLFKVEDGTNPLFDFKEAMVEVFKELRASSERQGEENRKVIAELRAASASSCESATRPTSASPRPRRPAPARAVTFEERVHEAIERIAAAARRLRHPHRRRGRRGRRQEGRHAGRARRRRRPSAGADRLRGQGQEALQERGLGRAQRGRWPRAPPTSRSSSSPARSASPRGREQLHEYEGNKLIVAVDRDEPDSLALEVAYRLAAARVCDGPRPRPRRRRRRGPRPAAEARLDPQAGSGDQLGADRDQDELGQGAHRPRRDGRRPSRRSSTGSTRWSACRDEQDASSSALGQQQVVLRAGALGADGGGRSRRSDPRRRVTTYSPSSKLTLRLPGWPGAISGRSRRSGPRPPIWTGSPDWFEIVITTRPAPNFVGLRRRPSSSSTSAAHLDRGRRARVVRVVLGAATGDEPLRQPVQRRLLRRISLLILRRNLIRTRGDRRRFDPAVSPSQTDFALGQHLVELGPGSGPRISSAIAWTSAASSTVSGG